ncbi:protein related to pac2 [Pyrrhoderma noxium]|uniref:Protein related to pac2 n=1 Tax=Pyrrhoderma noxium TaxID=2282107 RepID=A0A286U985_9AGAM|nr:protein related to pac2 [Pyrrhoderma noxium]
MLLISELRPIRKALKLSSSPLLKRRIPYLFPPHSPYRMALTTRLPASKVEPFYGFIETTGDALRLIQAARQGVVPRITRRLNDLERRTMIRSGAIFIFSDEESGIKRWTEGLSWSASRIVGNFLVYREVSDRAHSRSAPESRRSAKRRGNVLELSPADAAEQKLAKSLVGCLNDSNGRFKPNGLIKKTITVVVDGSDHHLIAYYSQEDVKLGRLLPLASRSDIMALDIPPELLESTKFRIPPITEDGPDGRPRYICDADEGDISHHISVPFPTVQQMPSLSHRLAQPTARVAVRDAVYPEYPSTPVSPMDMRAMFPLISNTPPSATSVSSSHSFEGVSWFPCVSQSPEQFQPMNMEHSLQPVSPTHTPGIMSERNNSPFSAQRLEQVSNNLLPAWNGDLEFGTTNSISYIQIPGTTILSFTTVSLVFFVARNTKPAKKVTEIHLTPVTASAQGIVSCLVSLPNPQI